MAGGGSVNLYNGINTYSGPTTVESGTTLALSGSATISASPTITVSEGATLDVSGVSGAFTLASGQALITNSTATVIARRLSRRGLHDHRQRNICR